MKKALKAFINKEADAQVEQIREMWEKPLKERVRAGEAIANITVVHNYSGERLTLRCSENHSKFRVGDYLRLHQGNPDGRNVYGCKVLEELGNELIVEAGYRVNFYGVQPSDDWVLDRNLVDIRHILIKALGRMGHREMRLLTKTTSPAFNPRKVEQARILPQITSLNDSQQAAFINAFSAENYYLIQGPPGTGKTWLLGHLAHALAKKGERVLISALSHRAINNALRQTYATHYYPHIIKIGEEYNATGLQWKSGMVRNYKSLSQSPYNEYSSGLIVGSTVYALHTRKLARMDFDTVIFDEAGQMTLPLALAGMVKAKRCIFIGDHQQLAPVLSAEYEEEETIQQSIFQALHNVDNSTMLTKTYRMNEEINAFPSHHFYNKKLVAGLVAAHRKLELKQLSSVFPVVLDPNIPSVFIDLAHRDKDIRCREEAILITKIILEAVNCGVSPAEIAVVAPYRAQGRLIRNMLYSTPSSIAPIDLKSIVVDTVERIQGQERELILISLTSSDPKHIAANARFFLRPNRLNVAITRAKTKRIVVGSRYLFNNNLIEGQLRECLDLFKAFYESCHIVDGSDI